MAIGSIYALKMRQELFTQDILNVFYYRQITTGSPVDAAGLFSAFDEDVLSVWADCVINSISVTEVEVINIAVPSDYWTGVPSNNVGTRLPTGNLRSPSWLAFGFKSNRSGAGTRSSYKRFAGLAEEDCNANSLDPAFVAIPAVVSLQSVMALNVNYGSSGYYTPIQVKSGWALGFTPIENFAISSWGTPYLTSQVSRKP